MDAPARSRRRDAAINRERVVDAALVVMAEQGVRVPVTAIAAAAGVGVATFYRSFGDRDELLQELERRAYADLDGLLDDVDRRGDRGLRAIEAFLIASLALSDRLVLPLHGAPPLTDPASVAARKRIDRRLQEHLDHARAAGVLTSDANATDVIVCSALVTQPLRHGPDWERSAARHIALFVAGLSAGRPLPGPPVAQSDVERAFRGAAPDGGDQAM